MKARFFVLFCLKNTFNLPHMKPKTLVAAYMRGTL